MTEKRTFDIIIAGAGASGLSLLDSLLNSPRGRNFNILLADRSLIPSDDKTWSFWLNQRTPLRHPVSHTWNKLLVDFDDFTHAETLKEYKYHCIRSFEYTNYVLDSARKRDNITILETEISGFSSRNSGAIMHTAVGEIKAARIFQSVLQPPGSDQAVNNISLKQHFTGWEIVTHKPVFNPDTAVFMDFRTPPKQGITFFYVLPFSKNRALVEYTLFSDSLLSAPEYEKSIEHYLRDKNGLHQDDYTIKRKENGVIPMSDRRYPAMYCNRVMNIGTVGGLTKPSTGYTFNRIQRHSRDIVTALEEGKKPPEKNRSSYRFRVYDMMFLYLMAHQPETAVSVFKDLFKKNRFDRILQFLDEDTHFGQELKIFTTVPPLPFLKSIYKMKQRILTGA